ncbi:hypothetical protein ACFXP3_06280 [Streptomyces sp. NPDC059096]|uniref:hypothetical protein n=1 Tax=unclassified Streptomyces TaxID=2593676 RepID=UPI003692C7BA
MSAYHYIFIQPGHPVEKVVSDISAACGAHLAQGSGGGEYGASLGYAAVEYEQSHEYDDDFGIPFSTYESVITIRDFDRTLERQELLAVRIYQNLAALGTYSLALVFDLQRLLDSSVVRRQS